MQLARMARSALRPMTVTTDVEAFRQHCGGSLGGLYHCMRYLGPRLLWDGGTGEFVDEAGAAVEGLEPLAGELALLRDAVGAALAGASTTGPGAPAPVSVLKDGPAPLPASPPVSPPVSMDGVLLRGQDGSAHYRIHDLIHPELPVWRQVNLLADLFSRLEHRLPHVRAVPHDHTPAMKTETRVARWLATWKRPGCGGVLLKRPELIYLPGGTTQDACWAGMRR